VLSSEESGPLSDEDVLVGSTWEMVAWYDTYDDFWRERGPLAAKPILVFKKDETFIQDNVGGCCRRTGKWELGGESETLSLEYTDGSDPAVYEVRQLTEEELCLAWRGQHGPVVERYVPEYPDDARQAPADGPCIDEPDA